MESQGVGEWNMCTEKNETGIFVVRTHLIAKRCLQRAELKDLEQVLLFVITAADDPVGLNCLFISILGHGDQRHAVHCDRVRKERRNVR